MVLIVRNLYECKKDTSSWLDTSSWFVMSTQDKRFSQSCAQDVSKWTCVSFAVNECSMRVCNLFLTSLINHVLIKNSWVTANNSRVLLEMYRAVFDYMQAWVKVGIKLHLTYDVVEIFYCNSWNYKVKWLTNRNTDPSILSNFPLLN